jgi:hypothetical protein
MVEQHDDDGDPAKSVESGDEGAKLERSLACYGVNTNLIPEWRRSTAGLAAAIRPSGMLASRMVKLRSWLP